MTEASFALYILISELTLFPTYNCSTPFKTAYVSPTAPAPLINGSATIEPSEINTFTTLVADTYKYVPVLSIANANGGDPTLHRSPI